MRAGVLVLVAVVGVLMLGALPAHASDPPSGWDGTNPFACTLQQAGLGATVPDPNADPYCVDFDKRHQNVDRARRRRLPGQRARARRRRGAQVLLLPVRPLARLGGRKRRLDQNLRVGRPVHFDKARGEGGVWVTNFNVNGQPGTRAASPASHRTGRATWARAPVA